jgi:hypothetical protein
MHDIERIKIIIAIVVSLCDFTLPFHVPVLAALLLVDLQNTATAHHLLSYMHVSSTALCIDDN